MRAMPPRRVLSAICVVVLAATGCGQVDASGDDGRVHPELQTTRHQELRPTDPSDSLGFEGAETKTFESPGGEFKVWWTESGDHAVPLQDADDSGVPDYVELVADVADEVAATLEEAGWEIAKSDDPGGSSPSYGGDGRFDIYLVDFPNGDGHYSPDWCQTNEHGVQQCAGHFRMENDFTGLNYPSREYAARLVLSHEYFHAVQNAYLKDVPAWLSEGTATWFEEFFDPAQDDFERLTSLYFREHTRSVHDRQRGPSDGFSYGASIFVYFLEQHIGADGLRSVFERLARGEQMMDALDAELTERWVPLSEAFDLFATYNLFTGRLAVDAHGYPEAGRFEGVSIDKQDVSRKFNWNLDVDPLAARYVRLDFDQEISLQKGTLEQFDATPQFIAVNRDEYAADGVMHILETEEATRFSAEMSPLYVVVSNGSHDATRAAALKVRLVDESEEGGDDSGGEDIAIDGGSQSEGGCSSAAGGSPLGPLSLCALLGLVAAALRGLGRARR